MVIGVQAAPLMCDVGVQCNLLHIPTTSTPKKGVIAPVAENEDTFELTEEEESETEPTESTIDWESTTTEDEEQIPVEKQLIFLVFESTLMLLFATCVACGSTFISIKRHVIGSFLSIKQACSQCNNTFVWESQPYIRNIPAGNLLISAAILFTGSLPAKALRVFKTLYCATISRKTFFRHQKKYLHPAIHVIWEKNQILLLSKLKEKQQGLVIGGDGRSDSPGHSAKYGSYSMLELNLNKIVDIQLVQVKLYYGEVCGVY